MSQWTHVAAVFRIDGFLGSPSIEEIKELIGKQLPSYYQKIHEIEDMYNLNWFDDFEKIIETKEYKEFMEEFSAMEKELEEHPERYIPTGSEGGLEYTIWQNPKSNSMAQYTVTVFGDLRNYNDYGEIKEWFHRICNHFMVRQAICNVDIEYYGSYNISYVNKEYNEEFYKCISEM